jgi:probable phosphoglycerate mutase
MTLGKKWYTHSWFKDTRFAEGTEFYQKNCDELFESLGYRHDRENNLYIPVNANNDKVALFAHQGFSLIFLSCVLDIPYPQFCTHFDMITTGVTAIEFREENGVVIPKVWQHAGDAHLYADRLPTLV